MHLLLISGGTRTNRIDSAIAFALILGALLALVGLGCRSTAQNAGQDLPPLRVGTSGDYRPFSWSGGAGERPYSGFSIALARAYARKTGRRVEWVPFRWSGLEADLARGRFDLAMSGVTVRADRSIAGRFSLPVTVSGAIVLVPAGSAFTDAAMLDRPEVQLAVNAGGHLERTARRLFPSAAIRPVAKNEDVLSQLGMPGIDAVVTDDLEAPHWLARRAGLRALGPLTRDYKAAWFPTVASDERARFDRWLLEAEGDGRLARWRTEHGLPPARTAEPVAALLASIDERLSLMPDVARAKHVLGRAIEDLAREERVLDAAVEAIDTEAKQRALRAPGPIAVRRFYRAQIEAAKAIQRDWAQRRSDPAIERETSAQAELDLNARIRPALIDLGDRIARLVVSASAGGDAPPTRDEVTRALDRHALAGDDVDAIHASLVGLLTPVR